MKKPLHHVTDHAVIRYLELVEGVDIEAIRREIGRVADRGIEAGANGVISAGFEGTTSQSEAPAARLRGSR